MLKKFFASVLLFSALNVMLYEVCAENVIILDSVDGAESEYETVKTYSVDYVSSNPYALIQKIVSLRFVTKETLYTVWHHINRTSYQN
ncbi:MAG: hypothetical protein J6U24_00315, partial [Paludibacteraceae bacterium]|nr:hypothetical protein [Paludibacteraceae bacterium]